MGFFKIVRVVTVVSSIGAQVTRKVTNITKLWKSGYKKTATVQSGALVVTTAVGAIMLYNPWIATNLVIMSVPTILSYIPILQMIPLIKTVVILGLDFLIM